MAETKCYNDEHVATHEALSLRTDRVFANCVDCVRWYVDDEPEARRWRRIGETEWRSGPVEERPTKCCNHPGETATHETRSPWSHRVFPNCLQCVRAYAVERPAAWAWRPIGEAEWRGGASAVPVPVDAPSSPARPTKRTCVGCARPYFSEDGFAVCPLCLLGTEAVAGVDALFGFIRMAIEKSNAETTPDGRWTRARRPGATEWGAWQCSGCGEFATSDRVPHASKCRNRGRHPQRDQIASRLASAFKQVARDIEVLPGAPFTLDPWCDGCGMWRNRSKTGHICDACGRSGVGAFFIFARRVAFEGGRGIEANPKIVDLSLPLIVVHCDDQSEPP